MEEEKQRKKMEKKMDIIFGFSLWSVCNSGLDVRKKNAGYEDMQEEEKKQKKKIVIIFGFSLWSIWRRWTRRRRNRSRRWS